MGLARMLCVVVLLLGQLLQPAEAVVLYAKHEALRRLFPEADDIVSRTLFLTEKQVHRIQELARSRLESPLQTVYIGKQQDTVLGYAFLDIHTVRTLPEAVFIALSPQGEVASTLLVAFHEPPEYMPSERWLQQFAGQPLTPDLWVRRGIAPISGATLSANAITDAVRRALAIYAVALSKEQP